MNMICMNGMRNSCPIVKPVSLERKAHRFFLDLYVHI